MWLRLLRPMISQPVRLASRLATVGKDLQRAEFRTPFWLNLQVRGAHKLRTVYWESMLAEVGPGVRFSHNVKVLGPARLRIGSNTKVLNNVILDARGGMRIGSDTQIGFESIVLTSSHRFDDTTQPITAQGMSCAPVRIGSDVWMGARVIVLPGVIIGDHAVVGAASVVVEDVPEWAVASGNPARLIRYRQGTENWART